MTDKGGFGAVLSNSEKEHQAIAICESADNFSLCRRSLSESGNSLMGKRRLLYGVVRVFLVKRGQNPPSMAAAGVGGARSLPWLLRAGHSGLELVGARAAKTSRGASNTR